MEHALAPAEGESYPLQLEQSGRRVDGRYTNGQLWGVLNEQCLEGEWHEGRSKGRFVWQFDADAQSFTGTWGKKRARPMVEAGPAIEVQTSTPQAGTESRDLPPRNA